MPSQRPQKSVQSQTKTFGEAIQLPEESMCIVGIDPGTSSGSICIVKFPGGKKQPTRSTINLTDVEIQLRSAMRSLLKEDGYDRSNLIVFFEKPTGLANPHRKQGMGSTIKFAEHVGEIKGFLAGLGVKRYPIRPQEWQKRLQCMTKGDKHITQKAAQQRFPEMHITLRNADSILIAHYGCILQLGVK